MFNVDSNAKVYIVSPYHNTGGPKSLHQLADILVEKGIDTYLIYYWNGKFTGETDILFSFCRAKVATDIIDNENNILITSESQCEILNGFSNIQRCIWWLSLDYYLTSSLLGSARNSIVRKKLPKILTPLMLIKYIINNPRCLIEQKSLNKRKLKYYKHLYNCEYEKNFLEKQNVSVDNMVYLCGPLEEKFYKIDFSDVVPYKKDIVAYNPTKMDMEFFEKVKEKVLLINNNIKFVAIQNMSRDQVYNTLKSAKVYIDFGYFPGPERMPREAVALYCNIITSTEGSSGNDVDVLVPSKFKFNIRDEKNVDHVADLINDMTINYHDYVKYGGKYRQKVWNQIVNFSKRISEIFEVVNETQ